MAPLHVTSIQKTVLKVGVMGSARPIANDEGGIAVADLAFRLGHAIASAGCVLVTGATTGLPYLVSKAARERGGMTIGFSPAINAEEHAADYGLPLDAVDLIMYTGFGLKGRNVLNVRASDIIIILGGAIGALNEFTIAYDEGKIIGILEGSGGIADRIRDIVSFADKPTGSILIFDRKPESLVDRCLEAVQSRR